MKLNTKPEAKALGFLLRGTLVPASAGFIRIGANQCGIVATSSATHSAANQRERMPENSATNRVPPAVRICRAVGVCIFILSYFLPVLPESKPGSMGHVDAMLGYQCAKAAFLWGIAGPPFMAILLLMSDLINLLVPGYLVLSFSEARSKFRDRVMILTSFCMIATWIVFAIFHTFPLIGHFLWLGGALLIIVPQWRFDQSASQENPAA